jgi:cysteine desulfurase/selenocysteine lyase
MNEVTPELIAQIATQLLNETPATPLDVPVTSAHSFPAGYHPAGYAPSSYVPAANAGSAYPVVHEPAAIPSASAFSGAEPDFGQHGQHQFAPQTISSSTGRGFGSYKPSEPIVPPVYTSQQAPSVLNAPSAGALSTNSTAPPAHAIADVSPDGLKNFVQQIRNPGSRAESENCYGAQALAFLQQAFQSHQVPAQTQTGGSRPLDIASIRRDFPALHQSVHGKPLIWFDNAATTQKPFAVIEAISSYYAHDNSNIHRAAHTLAARSTDAFEGVRDKVQKFLGAGSSREIIFVRGTTEGINLISQTYGRKFLQPGDEILLSGLEHHANIVPWQAVAKEKGAILRVIPFNERGEIMLEEYQSLLGPKTKLVALTQASNSLGTILPVAEMTQMAKRYGARVVIDGAQSVSHIPVNVQEVGCDFFVFSGHKIFGPTGIGVVYAREELQEIMPPWQGGGNMIKNVTFEETTFAEPPNKFEAGTPNIADTVGLGAALDYVQKLGLTNIGNYEHHLLEYATERLLPIPGLRLIGQAREKVSVISFVLKDRRTEDVGKMLDLEGIAVRAGHHCSQPSLRRYGLEATVRPSFAFYNTTDEIDHLVTTVKRISVGTIKSPRL